MNIGSLLVEKLDKHISDQIDVMTCSDIGNIYFDLVQSISDLGGNPDNSLFIGLFIT
ncbi:hypothetical protein [Brevibacillus choshinensis]|uniref:hypothetical protein n=1 Tax=Brevibacillus choshinensis TaxID=54911 RepID=UPI002E1A46B7|nr:hypothetical protein [Brevibacillus choshinensis]